MQLAIWKQDMENRKKRPLPDSNRGWRICNPTSNPRKQLFRCRLQEYKNVVYQQVYPQPNILRLFTPSSRGVFLRDLTFNPHVHLQPHRRSESVLHFNHHL